MNEALMKVVERAVRPVRASKARKLQMRLELLSHLTALYEEEQARLGDDAAAFDAARERFGDPAELSHELDRSVGPLDRWHWFEERIIRGVERQIGYREDRSVGWHAVRVTLTAVVATAAIAALVSALVATLPDDPSRAPLSALLPVLLFSTGCSLALHGAGIALTHEFERRERFAWIRSATFVIAASVAMSICFFAMWKAITGVWLLQDSMLVAPIVIGSIPCGLALVTWWRERVSHPYREWERLALDE